MLPVLRTLVLCIFKPLGHNRLGALPKCHHTGLGMGSALCPWPAVGSPQKQVACLPFQKLAVQGKRKDLYELLFGKTGVPEAVAHSVSPLLAQGNGLPRLLSLCPVHRQRLDS